MDAQSQTPPAPPPNQPSTPCCSPVMQVICCEPAEKAECCDNETGAADCRCQ